MIAAWTPTFGATECTLIGVTFFLLWVSAIVWAIRSKGGLRRGFEESLTNPNSTIFDTGPYQFVCALVCLPFLAVAELLKKERTPEQEATVERSLRLVLGQHFRVGEGRYAGQREYSGERGAFHVVVPGDLERIDFAVSPVGLYLRLRSLHGYAEPENVRFKRNGALGQGKKMVDALTVEAQAAVETLGRLGCTAIHFSDSLQLHMPYRQTPEQFADVVGEFARAGDAIAAAMADLIPYQTGFSPGETAGTGPTTPVQGSVGPPS